MSTARRKPPYILVDGVLIPPQFSPKCFREALSYQPKPGDLIIDTYPKSGTTWTQCIVIHILRRGVPLPDPKQFTYFSPFIDMLGNEGIQNMKQPGAIKTHLPFNLMPYSTEAKYIYVARNPFDLCVSFYYHAKSTRNLAFDDATFDDFFEVFMTGEVEYNDYFDHLLSWYPHLKDKNVFFTTYESLQENTKTVIVDMARFIGKEYSDLLEKDNNLLDDIIKYSSFDNMKQDLTGGSETQIEHSNPGHCNMRRYRKDFFRKGVVGDWKNYFSQEQFQRLNEKFENKTRGTDLFSMFSQ